MEFKILYVINLSIRMSSKSVNKFLRIKDFRSVVFITYFTHFILVKGGSDIHT